MIRILVVDDHEVVRVGLASVLGDVPDFQVTALVGTAEAAVSAAALHHPDVVLLDLRLPDRPGTAIVGELRQAAPNVKIVVLTSYGQDRAIVATMAAGVDAFLTKTADTESLITTIRSVLAGYTILHERAAAALVRYVQAGEGVGDNAPIAALTRRELDVARAVAEGLSNREIGERLNLSEKTVKNHVSEILDKLALVRRSQIVKVFGPLSDGDP